MRFTSSQIGQISKSAALGAFTGIVFAIVCIALPGAALLFVVGVLDIDWDLSWFPEALTILGLGALIGAIFASILYIKDQIIPYVETVQEFEEDADDDRFS
ncbi:MAG: hypothetical protein JKX94_03385 [Sneathiella sp.]|nr:hypothetical protein [Sneathiella sp.]